MSKFTFVELFAGIGGVSFGFEKAGGKCLMAAEYDPERKGKRQFAQEAYKILHPDTPVVGDVFELKSKDVPDHDVLSFTFPCQSFSVAGKRGGFDDTRGTLYFEAMRIANEKKPKIIFAENVKGLVNHDKGNTLDTIIKIANECGYIVDYEILNSKYFGVPQNRERWFMIGVRKDLIEVESWTNVVGTTIIPKSKKRIGEWAKTFNFDWPEQEEVTTRLRDILEPVVDDKYYLDEEKTARLVAQLNESLPAHFPTPNDVNNTLRTGGRGSLSAKHNYEHVAIKENDRFRIRELTSLERWRLQAFPDEAHETVKNAGIIDSQRYKQAGNAVTVSVIEAIGERLIPLLVSSDTAVTHAVTPST